jgi:hypothetical protein
MLFCLEVVRKRREDRRRRKRTEENLRAKSGRDIPKAPNKSILEDMP